jgi:4-amino-4-deoxy-L-arabinose transferase-like glycosyltransferase
MQDAQEPRAAVAGERPEHARRRSAVTGALLVALVAFGLRAWHLVAAAATPYPEHLAFLGDAAHYAEWSERIAAGRLVGPHSFYMGPLYPYSLALWSALAPGADAVPVGALWIQALLDTLSCLLVVWIVRRTVGPWQGVVAGLVAAGMAPFVYATGLLMPSTQGLFLNLLAVALLLLARERGARWAWLAAGAAIGLAALSKAPALLLLPAAWLWLALAFGEIPVRERLVRAALLAVGCVPLVGLATWHNHLADGDRVLLTANAGSNLWIGNGPGATGAHAGVTTEFESAKLDFHRFELERPEGEPPGSGVSRILTRRALAYMAEDPGRAAGLLWRKLRLFWGAHEVGTDDHLEFFRRFSGALRLPLPGVGLVAPLALAGMVLARRRWRELWPLYALVLTQTATFTVFLVLTRYRLASVACWIVFAALAIEHGAAAWRARRRGELALGAAALALGALLVHLPVAGMGPERGVGNQLYHLATAAAERGEDPTPLFEEAVGATWREGDLSLRQRAVSFLELGNAEVRAGRARRAANRYREGLEACAGMSPEFRYRAVLEEDLRRRLEFVEGARREGGAR